MEKVFRAALAALACAWSASSSAVFINELHYDNAGSDSGEAVEIAGAAGTDLTGWAVVLYNGNGGGAYVSIALGGVLPDLQSGFGVLQFAAPGMQNGDPDGLALVAPDGHVAQFLSYEGDFIATDGPAGGTRSTDIGVAEDGSTPVGSSLQLRGSGTGYANFSWSGPLAASFGAINPGQTFAAPVRTSTVPEPASLALALLGLGLLRRPRGPAAGSSGRTRPA